MALLEHEGNVDQVVQTGGGVFRGVSSVRLLEDRAFSAQLRVESHEDGWTATDSYTGVFGVGQTDADALRDLFTALREHREVLERQPALSKELETQLVYLRSVLP